MGKVRSFRNRQRPVPVEHPEGGTFHLFPFDAAKATAMSKDFTSTDFLFDRDGNIVFNQKTGEPVTTNEQDFEKMCDFVAREVIAGVSDIVDADTGEPVDMTPELVRQLVAEIDEPAEGETGKPKALLAWVLESARKLCKARRETEVKNS